MYLSYDGTIPDTIRMTSTHRNSCTGNPCAAKIVNAQHTPYRARALRDNLMLANVLIKPVQGAQFERERMGLIH